MNAHLTQYLAEAIAADIKRDANNPGRLMSHELRTTRRAARRRRRIR